MLKYSFVYSDPTRGVVTISIDDLELVEKFKKSVYDAIKTCTWHEKIEECRNYCNLYLDIQHEMDIVKYYKKVLEAKKAEETPEEEKDDSL